MTLDHAFFFKNCCASNSRVSELQFNTVHTVNYVQYRNLSTNWRALHRVSSLTYYRGADKSLARPEMKQAAPVKCAMDRRMD